MLQRQIRSFFTHYFSDPLIAFIFPALCTVCDTPLRKNESYLCAECRSKMTRLDMQYIRALKTEIQPRYFDELYVIYEFDSVFQTLIHLLKYQRFTGIAELFANAMTGAISYPYDAVSAVPLNPVRMRERGYNQSALIAEHFARKKAIPFQRHLMERIKNTPSQTKLNREQRIKNMQNAFICSRNLAGRKILLIDDVITTGSTLNACAQVLKAAGAKRVDIGALATPVGILQKSRESREADGLEIGNKSS